MPATLRITAALAQRHEALWLKLEALLAQGRNTALRKPEAPVGEDVRIIAEGLLHDSGIFGPKRRREALPTAATQWGGLVAQLGQAQALLAAYEAAHTGWDEEGRIRVWLVAGRPLPVERLLPRLNDPEHKAEMKELRVKLAQRMDRAYQGHFYRGYQAGKAAALRAIRAGEPVPVPQADRDWPRIRSFD